MPEPPLTAVITNGDQEEQTAKLDRFNHLPAFGRVFTSTELGAAKPAPECFLAACAQLGLAPERTIYVGDWLQGDAIAAHEAGLVGVWMDRGIHPDSDAPSTPQDSGGLPIQRIVAPIQLCALVESTRN